jgi:hypothetical protein
MGHISLPWLMIVVVYGCFKLRCGDCLMIVVVVY